MRYFGQKRLKWEQAQRYGCLSKEFAEYARQDAIDTWNLWPVVKEILEQCQQTQIFRIECAFIPVQVEMETTGILINQELLKEQESQLEIMKCGLERQMCESLGLDIYLQGELFGNGSLLMPLNFVSPKAVANYIHDRMGIELYIKGKTSWSVGKKTINQLLNKHPFFKLFQKYQAVRKLLTTYIRPYWKLLSSDGKIYPSFRHVRSGRCTSYSPNLQNQAKLNVLVPEINIRKLFTASKGNKFLKCDYDSQEIRLLAHITGDTEMINALFKKQDIHLATADRVFGLNIPYDALCKTSKDYLAYKKQFGLQRDKAKTVNFGIAYGKTPEGFAEDWNVPIEEARKVVSTFFRLYPNIRKSIQRCKEFQKLNKYTVTWCGRRRYYTTFTPKDLRSGFNHLIQGTGADMIKKAAGELWRYLQTLATIPRIVLIVHDEIIIENAIESIEQIVEPVRNYMQNTLQLAVPLVADPKVVLTYGD
jgi:DNA polymerase-1